MFLDKINNLMNNVKRNVEAHDFINELKEEIENENTSILDRIQKDNKVSIGTKNKIDSKMDEILKNYADETIENGDLYYVVEKKDNEYIVYKYGQEDDSVLKINENDLVSNVKIYCALRLKNETYVIDAEASAEIENRLINMVNELLEEQNQVLKNYRKEGHLYRVSEKINKSVFLHDITDNPNFEVEEVEFPGELLNEADEGTIFIYENGTYKLKGE